MFINIFVPPIEWLAYWAIRYIYRAYDQRSVYVGQFSRTHCRNLYSFITLYSGPNFFIHYKYAYIWTNIMLAMTFGPVMPMCYLYCLGSLCMMYLVERLAMAYSYRKPPMYDDKLSKVLLQTIRLAPILHCLVAIHAYSNQQVFQNAVYPLKGVDMNPEPHHELYHLFDQVNPATVYLVCVPIVILNWALQVKGLNLARHCPCKCLRPPKVAWKSEKDYCQSIVNDGYRFFDRLRKQDLHAWANEEKELRGYFFLRRQ